MASQIAKINLGLTPAANRMIHYTSDSAASMITTAALGLSLLASADAATAQQAMDTEVGVDVQAYSARLAEIAALSVTDSNIIVGNGSSWVAESGSTARTSLGLGTGDSPTFTNLVLSGNLTVQGAMEIMKGSVYLNYADYQVLNAGYTSSAALAVGTVSIYQGSATTQTIAAGGFVTGVNGVSNPTIEVTSTTGFSTGNFVQVVGSTSNDGLYEIQGVLSTPARLELRGVGLNARVEAFTLNNVGTEAGAGTVTKCSVSVTRAGTDGVPEVAYGASTGLSYVNVALVGGGLNESVSSITNDTTMVAQSYISATLSAQKTLTLVSAPADGTRVKIKNKLSSSNNLLVARGGSDTMDGSASSLTLAPGSGVELVYVAAVTDWEVWA